MQVVLRKLLHRALSLGVAQLLTVRVSLHMQLQRLPAEEHVHPKLELVTMDHSAVRTLQKVVLFKIAEPVQQIK
jgi:hypothetical protein